MNDRIQELAVQAYELCNKRTYGTVHSQEEFNQKFAELIVAECAKVCDELQKWPSTEPRHCASDIRIHFGVEE